MSSTTQDFGGSDYTTTYDYTVGPAGSTRTIEYPGGRTVVETFDLRGRLEEVSGGTGVGAEWTFDGADRRTAAALANGVDSVFDFDVNSRLTRITHAKDSTTLFDVGFGYDENGTKLFSRDYVFTTRSELYGHDPRRRLRGMERGTLNTGGTAITTPLADANLASAQGWPDLDRRGNWPTFEQTVNGSSSEQTRLANGVNEYTAIDPDGSGGQQAVNPTYDDAGNMLTDPITTNPGWTYEYDEENRLTSADWQVGQYGGGLAIYYDALGRRVSSVRTQYTPLGSSMATTRHVYSGLSVIEEYDLIGTLDREFVWGASFTEPVAMIRHLGGSTTQVLHYLQGALGSVAALTDDSGAVVERYFYDPYGKTYIYSSGGTLLSQSAYGNPFGWTGQRYDPSVKLYHFWARTYSPALGRWLQRDPLGYVDGVSLYEYSGSGSLTATDPLGLSPLWGIGIWGSHLVMWLAAQPPGEHHYFPQSLRKQCVEEGLSDVAERVFKDAVTEKIPGGHGWSEPHELYNDAVEELWEEFREEKNLDDLEEMTEKQAREFVDRIKKSRNPHIHKFLDNIAKTIAQGRRIATLSKFGTRAARLAGKLAVPVTVALFAHDVYAEGLETAVKNQLWPLPELLNGIGPPKITPTPVPPGEQHGPPLIITPGLPARMERLNHINQWS